MAEEYNDCDDPDEVEVLEIDGGRGKGDMVSLVVVGRARGSNYVGSECGGVT